MNEYMMIFRNERKEGAPAPSPEQMQLAVKQWQDWIRGIALKGKYIGTNRLLSEAKTIKPGNVISDGPYAEVKEIVGGYLIVNANTLDEALELAKECPALAYGGNVEVRLVMNVERDLNAKNFLEPL